MARRPMKTDDEMLQAIRRFIAEHGWGPSYKELARATGYRTVCDIGNRLRRLAVSGKILYGGGPRQIALPAPRLPETQGSIGGTNNEPV